MGAAAGPLASATSLASAGFSAYGDELKGNANALQAEGQSQSDIFQSEIADRKAAYGAVAGQQVTGELTNRLVTTLGNIDSVRAAAHTDPSSPTGQAFRQNQENYGNTQKEIQVGNITEQTEQDKSDAAYLRSASTTALMSASMDKEMGKVAAMGDLAKAGASAIPLFG